MQSPLHGPIEFGTADVADQTTSIIDDIESGGVRLKRIEHRIEGTLYGNRKEFRRHKSFH